MNHDRLWSDEHMGCSSESADGIFVIRWPRKMTESQMEHLEGLMSLALKSARQHVVPTPVPIADSIPGPTDPETDPGVTDASTPDRDSAPHR